MVEGVSQRKRAGLFTVLQSRYPTYSRRYGVGHCEPGRGGDCPWWKVSLRGRGLGSSLCFSPGTLPIVDAMVSATVSLAEVVTARGGRRISEEEGWALLCASVQVPYL